MLSLIIVLLIAGIFAGLIQFFADYKGLPLHEPAPPLEGQGFEEAPAKSFWEKLYDFARNHWQFFGYLVIGIAGSFLVPVVNQFSGLPGVSDYLLCIDNDPKTACATKDWYLLVLLGYGIILGYSSVRLIRSFGTFVLGNITKKQADQQQMLDNAQKQIAELKSKLATIAPVNPQAFEDAFFKDQPPGIPTPNSLDDDNARAELTAIAGFESCTENPGSKPWKDWRPAASLKTLLAQVNKLAPARKKDSDGMIGDTAHQERDSDHNPWVWDEVAKKGVVTALDITHDPTGKCDCQKLAKSLEDNKDSRVKYVIWNKQIMNSSAVNGVAAWTWRPYNGTNPHTKHIHISVKCEKTEYDKVDNWKMDIV